MSVDCDTCREALSARRDAEAEPVGPEWTDAHLLVCAACREWQQDVAELTELAQVTLPALPPAPDLSSVILARVTGRGSR